MNKIRSKRIALCSWFIAWTFLGMGIAFSIPEATFNQQYSAFLICEGIAFGIYAIAKAIESS